MRPLELSPSAARMLAGFAQHEPRPPSAASITEAFSKRTGHSVADLKGPSRRYPIVHARQELMALLQEESGKSTPWIGKFLGGRDHTTVLHGVKRHKARAASQ